MISKNISKSLRRRGGFGKIRSSFACISFLVLAGNASAVSVQRFSYSFNDQEAGLGKVSAQLAKQSAMWVGEVVDEVHMREWRGKLTAVLRQSGYPIGLIVLTKSAQADAQRTGVVQFRVFLGAIGRLDLKNTSRVSDERLLRTIRQAMCEEPQDVGHGCVLEASRLERATQLLQDIPGVSLASAPQLDSSGVATGETHMVMQTEPRGKPWTADLTLDNGGTHSTGSLRLGVVASGNNLFGAGDQYQASLFTTNKHMWSGSAGMSAPLGYDGLRWSTSVGRSLYSINEGVLVKAVADAVSVGVVYPFVRGLDLNVNGVLEAMETRTRVTYPDYGFAVHSRLHAIRGTLSGNDGDRSQQLGLSQWQGSVALTVGDQQNDDSQDVAPKRAGHYAKLFAAISRRQNVTDSGNIYAVANVRGQLSNKNLDYSEMLSLGGPSGVRAYRSDEGAVDQGVIASLDVKWRFAAPWGGQILPGVFADYAVGQVNRKPWLGWETGYPGVAHISNRRRLAGYGVSLDWVSQSGLTASLAWAKRFPFSDDSWISPGSANSRIWITLSFLNKT
ncbi:ShlB/FhaC/HecB family hemolysin secretion/activation protein [Burkholderia reimsis]|uniref:ShlB/FhaC/HecB family hemolysin secretion/activation protein n=1 Tax=Burkholderia reimsis TaxID=2234132 RepID=UPI0010583D1D|nr:ShlB/FhaC/HecB family hemolysin secretion/activation protein [Burkholderia reimsis]